VLDPKTGEPIPDAPDDLADKKATLGTGGDVQGPSLVRKPRRPTVAATGSTVTASRPAGDSDATSGSIEPPGEAEVRSGRESARRVARDEGNGEAGASGEPAGSERDST
jgi:hypothetical protein